MTVTILAGGDVCWSEQRERQEIASIKLETPGLDVGDWRPEWPRLPLVYRGAADLAARHGAAGARFWAQSRRAQWQRFPIEAPADPDEAMRQPLRRIAPVLRDADVTFVNLETPLSDRARWSGYFRTPARFAEALAWAGVDVVSTASNHAFDCGEEGMLDTLAALEGAGVQAAGTGRDLAAARRPAVLARNGVRVAVLAYTLTESAGPMAFATEDRSGVAPLDPDLVVEDIGAAAREAEVVLVSLHWGLLDSPRVHPRQRFLARGFLQCRRPRRAGPPSSRAPGHRDGGRQARGLFPRDPRLPPQPRRLDRQYAAAPHL